RQPQQNSATVRISLMYGTASRRASSLTRAAGARQDVPAERAKRQLLGTCDSPSALLARTSPPATPAPSAPHFPQFHAGVAGALLNPTPAGVVVPGVPGEPTRKRDGGHVRPEPPMGWQMRMIQGRGRARWLLTRA